jgi:transposase
MLSQLVLPLLPAGAREIAPGVGVLAGEDGGGLVTVHGLATFAWDPGDEAGRRLAAVQLVRLRAASQGQVAEGFGVDPATIWRWDRALAGSGVAGLVPARRGPKRASKLTAEMIARIRGLDAAGMSLRQIAAAAGVSTFSVRHALGRVAPGPAGSPQPPGMGMPGTMTAAARLAGRAGPRTPGKSWRCCQIQCPGMASGRWRGGGCSVRAPIRYSRRAPGTRWPGCCWPCPRWRALGCWRSPARSMAGSGTGSTGWPRRC